MKADFQKHAREVLYWHSTAVKLHAAAKVLQREIEIDLQRLETARYEDGTTLSSSQIPGFQLFSAFSLLAAFALENQLKGILISRTPELVLEHRLHKSLSTHRLLHLARRAGFELNAVDAFFLAAATEYSTWAGKYHTPKQLPGRTFSWVSSQANFVAFDRLYSLFGIELAKDGIPHITYKLIGKPPKNTT